MGKQAKYMYWDLLAEAMHNAEHMEKGRILLLREMFSLQAWEALPHTVRRVLGKKFYKFAARHSGIVNPCGKRKGIQLYVTAAA